MENPEAASPSLVGQIIADRYRLVRKLGEGGMGEVYEAEHIHIEKRVALKLLRAEIMSNQEAVTRFRQEARSASSLGHKNIIEIDDFGTLPDGRVYMTMEFLNGAPLSDLIKAGLPLNRALDVMVQTCAGLGAAHAKGIVHRDMKPDNIFVVQGQDGKDVPKILDFGIAKVSAADNNAHLTRTGTIFGTPYYMAPEQALGQAIDHRADVYAIGVILYEIFAGVVPFKADSFMGILTMHITTPPQPLSQVAAAFGRWVPPELEAIVMRTLAKNPGERFQSMAELGNALIAIYRQYVGAGSTQPIAAAAVSPSQFVPVATGYVPVQAGVTPMPTPGQGLPGIAATVAPPGLMTPGAGLAPGSYPPGSYPPGSYPPGGYPPGGYPPGAAPMSGGVPTQTPPGMAFPGAMGPGMSAGGMDRGASVGFEAPARSGRGALFAVLGLLLAGGAGAAWYFLLGPGAGKGEGIASASPATDGGGEPVQVPVQDPGPTGKDPTEPGKEPGKEPAVVDPPLVKTEEVVVLVDSIPRGATVFDGQTSLGQTPLNVKITKGSGRTLRLERSGFDTTEIAVDGLNPTVTTALDKTRTGRPGRPGDRPGDKPGDRPGDRPGDKPGDRPGDKPGDKPGNPSGTPGPGDKPDPGDKPGNGKNRPKDPPPKDPNEPELE